MRSAAMILAALLATTAAHAEPDHAFVAGGFELGGDHFLNAAYALEGGVRLGALPLAVHASGSRGAALDADGAGSFWRFAAGLEARAYRATGGFGFVGAECGYQHQRWDSGDPEENEEHRGPVVGLRGGYEGGGEHLRVRAAFDLYRYRREFVGQGTAWETGGRLSFAVGYRW